MSLLPARNNKIIYGAIFLFALIVLAFVLFFFKNGFTSMSFEKPSNTATKNIVLINNKDSDGDGLKNWEEVLWKTDPNNPDSDGDGTTDGEEIRTNRDPTTAGPNDKIGGVVDRQKKYSSGGPLTATDKLARDLFSNFIILYESGKLTDANKKILLDKVTKNNAVNLKRATYTVADMNIAPNGSKYLKKYYAEFNKILSKNENTENEFLTLQKALSGGKKEDLAPLEQTMLTYDRISKGLLKLPVPKEIAEINTIFVNSFSNLAEDVRGISTIFEDPLTALTGINSYIKDEQILTDAGKKLGAYLKK